ncbi:MAG: hypothetical protein Alpg2KO_30170 [Alphaproteobacteria bacterium]
MRLLAIATSCETVYLSTVSHMSNDYRSATRSYPPMYTPPGQINHAILAVRDLGRAVAFFERLGFDVNDLGVDEGEWGTCGYMIHLGSQVLELRAVMRKDGHLGHLDRYLSAFGEGLYGVGLGCAGTSVEDCFSRRADLFEDSTIWTRKTDFGMVIERPVAALVERMSPGFYTQFSIDFPNDGEAWHDNGALSITGLTAIAERPEALAEDWSRALGEECIREGKGMLEVQLGTVRLSFLTRTRFARRFPAMRLPNGRPGLKVLTLASEDLTLTEAWFAEQGLDTITVPGLRVLVRPEDALGTVLEFTPSLPDDE